MSQKKCKKCGAEFTPIQYPGSTLKTAICRSCTSEIQKERMKKHVAKQRRKKEEERKAFNRETKRLKECIKSKSQWIKEAQSAINKYVRLRDYFLPCISCGVEFPEDKFTGGAWDAGHFKSRGSKSQLRFNLWNIHKQCKKCNGTHPSAGLKMDEVARNYEKNLRLKIGDEKVDYLNNNNEIERFDIEYLKRVKSIFTRKARKLEKKLTHHNECN